MDSGRLCFTEGRLYMRRTGATLRHLAVLHITIVCPRVLCMRAIHMNARAVSGPLVLHPAPYIHHLFGLSRPQIEENWENFDIRILRRISVHVTLCTRPSLSCHTNADSNRRSVLSSFRRFRHAYLIQSCTLPLSIGIFFYSSSSLFYFCSSVFLVTSIFLFCLLSCGLFLLVFVLLLACFHYF
jgi:hypothetical protein